MTQHIDPLTTIVDQGLLLDNHRILMLQGHPSRFWAELADEFRSNGARVHKVHLCLADQVFWGNRPGTAYRGSLANWPDWLESFVKTHGITDILYYADRLPYHVAAKDLAKRLNKRAWVVEFGYLRPDWLTFEAGGMGAFSQFDRSSIALEKLARRNPKPDMEVRYNYGFSTEAANEVTYGLLSAFGQLAYPRYKADRVFWPVFDYLSWIPKLLVGPVRRMQAERVEKRAMTGTGPYFLLPMQIASDYQIRDNSPYTKLSHFVDEVMESFARCATQNTRLIVKLHPLDSGLERWTLRCKRLARLHGIADRVDVIRGGDLGNLIDHSDGVVLVNSTVGLHALQRSVPVIARGAAIYDLEGLTHQGGLDHFWRGPDPVDPSKLDVFLRALGTIQVKGSFFDPAGRAAARREIARRMAAENKAVLTMGRTLPST